MEITRSGFREAFALFLDACPGPPLAKAALYAAAFQEVEGLPGPRASKVRNGAAVRRGQSLEPEGYLRSVIDVAQRVKCRPAYLSKAALLHGYMFSRALRWVRFLHGVALLAQGDRLDAVAWRLGFNDVAGWSRFTRRLVGRNPRQLPAVPFEFWVRKAIDDVYFGVPASGLLRTAEERGREDK